MNGFMTRGRLMIVLVCATALAAMALPGSAMAGRAHLLKLYKVEKHVDLMGQDDTYNVSCPGNDLAIQGMWRVDNVDQDNDFYDDNGPGGSWGTTSPPASNDHADWDVLRAVRPIEVQAADDFSYDFKFTPLSGGDAQIKLWVTCLGNPSESIGGHTVSWTITSNYTNTITQTATTDADDTATSCASGEIAVQPGFNITQGDADLTAFEATNSERDWNWSYRNIVLDDSLVPTFSVTDTSNCMALRSNPASDGSGHRHRIVKKRANSFGPANFLADRVSEVQAHCGELYKGMIGGWNYNSFEDDMYFLGMDPRIKIRAFRFITRNGVTPAVNSIVSLLCFKDKTT